MIDVTAEEVENTTKFVTECYKKKNIVINTCRDECLFGIRFVNNKSIGGGVCNSDVELMTVLSKFYAPKACYAVGNAYGFSTLVLGTLFPNLNIDVIDAECEGIDNHLGSELTREIAKENKMNINLFAGYSPKDTHKCLRCQEYDFAFIDGLHTNDQLVYDFIGIYAKLSERCIVMLHDVKLCNLYEGINRICKMDTNFKFQTYNSRHYSNSIGTGFLYRGWDTDITKKICAVDKSINIVNCDGFILSNRLYQPSNIYNTHGGIITTSQEGNIQFIRSKENGYVPFQWIGYDIEGKINYVIDFEVQFTKFIPTCHPEVGLRFHGIPIVVNDWLKTCEVGVWKSVHFELNRTTNSRELILLKFDNAEPSVEFNLRNFVVK